MKKLSSLTKSEMFFTEETKPGPQNQLQWVPWWGDQRHFGGQKSFGAQRLLGDPKCWGDNTVVRLYVVRFPNFYFGSIQYSWGTWLGHCRLHITAKNSRVDCVDSGGGQVGFEDRLRRKQLQIKPFPKKALSAHRRRSQHHHHESSVTVLSIQL